MKNFDCGFNPGSINIRACGISEKNKSKKKKLLLFYHVFCTKR